MKRILLVVFLCFIALQGYSQIGIEYQSYPTLFGLFGGAGCATSNNYDVAPSGGFYFEKSLQGSRYNIGAVLLYQQYSLFYDNEANSAKHELGYAGETMRYKSSYVFIDPQFSYLLKNKINFNTWVNVNAGVGFKVSGFDSVHKWDRGYYTNGFYTTTNTGIGQYDSVLDGSKNMRSMLIRFGVGLTENIHLGNRGHFWFSFKEDFGFIAKGLTQTGTAAAGSPAPGPYTIQKLNPGYISLQVGISYIKGRSHD